MLSAKEATDKILSEKIDLGEISLPFEQAKGRVLTEDITADRDFPPFDRVTMDGYALWGKSYASGQHIFKVQSIQYAGERAKTLHKTEDCIEVMTGAVLPGNTDTVIRYEDSDRHGDEVHFANGLEIKKNVHRQGFDRKKGDVLLRKGHGLSHADLALLATVGKIQVRVRAFPKVAILTSGDELVPVEQSPLPHQIRRSNVYSIASLLKPLAEKTEHFHLPDDLQESVNQLTGILNRFDIIILSGGVSAGKKDYIPEAMHRLGVARIFHKIAQKPGKPMWFGQSGKHLVFALPGNPVSAFMCTVRYVKPWFLHNAGIEAEKQEAILAEDLSFKPDLSYFMQVTLKQERGQTFAYPRKGHGSGDLANLSDAHAFLELPKTKETVFKAGGVYRVWEW